MSIVFSNPYPNQWLCMDDAMRGITIIGIGHTKAMAEMDLQMQIHGTTALETLTLTYTSIEEARRRIGAGQTDIADSILAHAQGRIVESGFLIPQGETS